MAEAKDINPRNNNYLLGQVQAEQLFLNAWKGENLHHAWILSGRKGVGKATLAYRIARFMLWADAADKEKYNSLNVPENSPIFRQVADGSHPDLKVLERGLIETDKRKVIKAIQSGDPLDDEELAKLKKSAFIRIDEVRETVDFLSKTSFNNGWKIVIIDSADEMNRNAENALLKILEEPPAKTLILLICHNLGMLLPTIRSRCVKLNLQDLPTNEVASLLRRYRPDLNEKMVAKLSEMSDGSIGTAIQYADHDAIKIYDDLCKIALSKGQGALSDTLEFCRDLAADAEKFALSEELFYKFFRNLMMENKNTEEVYKCYQSAKKMFAECTSINMDKSLMLLNLFNDISKVI